MNSSLGSILSKLRYPKPKSGNTRAGRGFREVRGAIVLGAWESHVHWEGLQ